MDAREEAAELMTDAATDPIHDLKLSRLLMAVKRHLDAIDEDLQKLRKELRTQNNGGENG